MPKKAVTGEQIAINFYEGLKGRAQAILYMKHLHLDSIPHLPWKLAKTAGFFCHPGDALYRFFFLRTFQRLCAPSTKILSIMVDDLDYHLDENLELVESEEVQSDLQALDCCLAKIF